MRIVSRISKRTVNYCMVGNVVTYVRETRSIWITFGFALGLFGFVMCHANSINLEIDCQMFLHPDFVLV